MLRFAQKLNKMYRLNLEILRLREIYVFLKKEYNKKKLPLQSFIFLKRHW